VGRVGNEAWVYDGRKDGNEGNGTGFDVSGVGNRGGPRSVCGGCQLYSI
jgi:hypothetical protein